MPKQLATELFHKIEALGIMTPGDESRQKLFAMLVEHYHRPTLIRKYALRYVQDKLANDLSVIVMNAMHVKRRIGPILENFDQKDKVLKNLEEIKFKGTLANERLKGTCSSVMDGRGDIEEVDLKRILDDLEGRFENEPTMNPVVLEMTRESEPVILIGNRDQMVFVLTLSVMMMRSFSNLLEGAEYPIKVLYRLTGVGHEFIFDAPIPASENMMNSNEFIMIRGVIEDNHFGSVESAGTPEGGHRIHIVVPNPEKAS